MFATPTRTQKSFNDEPHGLELENLFQSAYSIFVPNVARRLELVNVYVVNAVSRNKQHDPKIMLLTSVRGSLTNASDRSIY